MLAAPHSEPKLPLAYRLDSSPPPSAHMKESSRSPRVLFEPRSWVKRHSQSPRIFHKELHRRLLPVLEKSWLPADPDLFWAVFVPTLLGKINPAKWLGYCYARTLVASPASHLAFLLTLENLKYFKRLETKATVIHWFVSPTKVPTSDIHLIDLPAKTISETLDDAIRKQGTDQARQVLLPFLEEWTRLLQEKASDIPPSADLCAESKKLLIDLELRLEKARPKMRASRAQVKKALRILAPSFSPQALTHMLNTLRRATEVHRGSLASLDIYNNELLVTEAHCDPSLAQEELGKTRWAAESVASHGPGARIARFRTEKVQKAIGAHLRARSSIRRHNADEVFATYRSWLDKIHQIRQKYQNRDIYEEDVVASYPWLSLLEAQLILSSEMRSAVALEITARRLKVPPHYCTVLIGKAKKTQAIRIAWAKYFKSCVFRGNVLRHARKLDPR